MASGGENGPLRNKIYLAAIMAIVSSMLIILVLTSITIDPYIKATNWGVNLFDFYENNKENNKIYFLGDSLAVYGVDPVIIGKILSASNLSFKGLTLNNLSNFFLFR